MDSEIPIIKGAMPASHQREHREMLKNESGEADTDALVVPGKQDEPWLNVLDTFEPGSRLAVKYILNDVQLGSKLKVMFLI